MNMHFASMSGTSATSTIVGDVKVAVIGLGIIYSHFVNALRFLYGANTHARPSWSDSHQSTA